MPNVYYPTDIVMVDVATQRATLDTTLIGTLAMAYHDGKLFVARGAGYTRVSILNAETLAVERTQLLPGIRPLPSSPATVRISTRRMATAMLPRCEWLTARSRPTSWCR